jgi:hypothetical protein
MSTSRRRKKGLLTGALALLVAGGAGVGILAATGGAANAAIDGPNGGLVPLFINAGPISLPAQTSSIKVALPGAGEDCIAGPFNSAVNIDTGFQVNDDTQVEITAHNDGACKGTEVGNVAYRLTYDGPAPTSGALTQVLVHILNPHVSVCTDAGWSDGKPVTCRDA